MRRKRGKGKKKWKRHGVYSFLPVRQTIPLCNDVQRKTIKSDEINWYIFHTLLHLCFFFFHSFLQQIFPCLIFFRTHIFFRNTSNEHEAYLSNFVVLHHLLAATEKKLFARSFSFLLSLSALWSVHVAINSNQLNLITNNMKLE